MMKRKQLQLKTVVRAYIVGTLVGCIFVATACNNFSLSPSMSAKKRGVLSVASWNVQTLFDATTTGREYRDFINSRFWNEEAYSKRLERMCQIIERVNSDVFVFQEIENEAVLADIVNYLSWQGNPTLAYTYAVFVPSRDNVLGCAVLSRYPIVSCTSHQIDYRLTEQIQPDMRPLVEVLIQASFSKPVRVYTGHWKSKSGGAESSEPWRDAQEALVARRIWETGDQMYVFAGDCNRDLSEFAHDGPYIVLDSNKQKVKTQSPYLDAFYYDTGGTYYYQQEWSKIDHFFVGNDLDIQDFCIENTGNHVDKDSLPYRFTIWNGQGYSDHFPISCVVSEL